MCSINGDVRYIKITDIHWTLSLVTKTLSKLEPEKHVLFSIRFEYLACSTSHMICVQRWRKLASSLFFLRKVQDILLLPFTNPNRYGVKMGILNVGSTCAWSIVYVTETILDQISSHAKGRLFVSKPQWKTYMYFYFKMQYYRMKCHSRFHSPWKSALSKVKLYDKRSK